MIEKLYYRGNEIAVNSVTGRNLAYENLTIWREELETMRDLLGSLANVPAKDILGVRAPSLNVGFDAQYQGWLLLLLTNDVQSPLVIVDSSVGGKMSTIMSNSTITGEKHAKIHNRSGKSVHYNEKLHYYGVHYYERRL